MCYSVGSGYFGTKGIVTVSAGIDADQEETVRAEILHQLDACKQGDITQQELAAAREAMLSGLRTVYDSPGAIEGFHATAALSSLTLSVEDYREAICAATVQDVVRAANSVQLHSSFFLKGVGA